MKDHLEQLVRGHDPLQGRNLAREYLQARILGALQRAGAMTALAFQGGTCLRFLFSLPRYSEDLDFTLEREPADYSLRRCLRAVRAELSAERYDVDLRVRDQRRAVRSAVVRFRGVLHDVGLSPHPAEVLAVRIEVDTRPPAGATTGVSLVRRHETLRLFHHDRASLLAGKLHAVLQRPHAKGRDLYDRDHPGGDKMVQDAKTASRSSSKPASSGERRVCPRPKACAAAGAPSCRRWIRIVSAAGSTSHSSATPCLA